MENMSTASLANTHKNIQMLKNEMGENAQQYQVWL
jgi:hypothetical protein